MKDERRRWTWRARRYAPDGKGRWGELIQEEITGHGPENQVVNIRLNLRATLNRGTKYKSTLSNESDELFLSDITSVAKCFPRLKQAVHVSNSRG